MNPDEIKASHTRSRLASLIIGLSMIGITLAATAAVWTADEENRGQVTQLVFSSVLPLFGTWVGTVLAFYFARESLQAATESSILLARGRDADTPVRQAMTPRAKMKVLALAFLILIGVLLVIEGWNPEAVEENHLKNYAYFAMVFSFLVELVNMRFRKSKQPVQLHNRPRASKDEADILDFTG